MQDRIPHYIHLPLVIGEDGRRLAKRHGDTRIETYRRLGIKPRRILSLLAKWCGIADWRKAADDPRELIAPFDLTRIPHSPIVFTAADDQWLRQTE
jgi:glutamyl-tRNA synthetase